MTDWLKSEQTSPHLKLPVVKALNSLSVVPPEVCDVLIAVSTEPDAHETFIYHALRPLHKAGGFDPSRLTVIVERKADSRYLGSYLDVIAACSSDRDRRAAALRRFTGHSNSKVSAAARDRMAKLGCDDPEVIDFVRSKLNSDKPKDRAYGATLAEPIARETGLLVAELYAALEDRGTWEVPIRSKRYVNDKAVAGLAALGEQALPALFERLGHSDAAVRGLAARALGQIGHSEAVIPLVTMLKETDPAPPPEYWGAFGSLEKVRLEALRALAEIGEPHLQHVVPEFQKLLEQDWARLDAIHAIGRAGVSARPMLPRLMAISRTADRRTKEAIARAVTGISPTDKFSLLGIRVMIQEQRKGTPKRDWQSLTAFCDTMKHVQTLGDRAKPLIPELKQLVDQEELVYFAVRAYAAAALAVIDKEDARWQSMVDHYESGPWLNNGRVGSYDIESSIWGHLQELQR